MLIRFSVENFLSFQKEQTLNLTAVSTCKERIEDNVFSVSGKKLLKSAVIYGANASGKSNLIKAMNFFKLFILKSTDLEGNINFNPFLFDSVSKNAPSKFEIEFFLDEKIYRYGFHVTKEKTVREWLYEGKKAVFLRANENNEDVIEVSDIWEKAHGLEERTRENALFLSVCAQWNVPEAQAVIKCVADKIQPISGDEPDLLLRYSLEHYQSGEYRNDILSFLQNSDTSIQDLSFEKGERVFFYHVKSIHNQYDEAGKIIDHVPIPLENESLGTQKILALAGPLVDCLKNGDVLFVDELDSRLHPVLTRQIIRMFNSKETNPYNAQLIFNTHDSNLLSYKVYDEKSNTLQNLFRRDQIYFTEKDKVEATHLYSLVEFKKKDGASVRNDASYEKDYLNGRYGAIPFVGDLLNFSAEEK